MSNKACVIKQVKGLTSILVEAETDTSQTMVKLCRNGNEYLSPTGWGKPNKSTLLDSECTDGLTVFSIPDAFVGHLETGDEISMIIPALNVHGTFVWTSPKTKVDIEAEQPAKKHGLFSRFAKTEDTNAEQLSEVELLAVQARRAAEHSSEEMRRAAQAKAEAEKRAREAARLAEEASRLEQERIEQAKKAERALREAEAARIAEEKRREAERKAEEARLAEEARQAEEKRRAEAVKKLEDYRASEIKRAEAQKQQVRETMAALKARAQETNAEVEKARALASKQAELETRAVQNLEKAQAKLAKCETDLEKRLAVVQDLREQRRSLEKHLAEQIKLTNKARSIAQKSDIAHAEAEAAAKAALAKAKELKAAAVEAAEYLKSCESKLEASQTRAADLAEKLAQTEQKQTNIRAHLKKLKDEASKASAGLTSVRDKKTAIHVQLREYDHKIANLKSELANTHQVEDQLWAKIRHLKAQEITPENVDTMKSVLDGAAPVAKVAALTSTSANAARLVQEDEMSEGSVRGLSKFKTLFRREKASSRAAEVQDKAEKQQTSKKKEKKPEDAKPVKETKPENVTVTPAQSSGKESAGRSTKKHSADKTAAKPVEAQKADLAVNENEPHSTSRKIVGGLAAALLVSVGGLALYAASRSGAPKPAIEAEASPQTQPSSQPDAQQPATETLATLTLPDTQETSNTNTDSDQTIDMKAPETPKEASTGSTVKAPVKNATDDNTPGIKKTEEIKQTQTAKKPETLKKSENSPAVTTPTKINIRTTPKKPSVQKQAALKLPAVKKAKAVLAKPVTQRKTVKTASLPVSKIKPTAKQKLLTDSAPKSEPATKTPRQKAVADPYSDLTRDVQKKLKELGFYNGAVTGRLDADTTRAMAKFQTLFGMPVRTRVTPEFLNELNATKVTKAVPEQEKKTELPVAKPETQKAPTQIASLTKPEVKPEKVKEKAPKPDIIVEAKKTKAVAARYPGVALRRGYDQNTTVVVSYDVSPAGNVINAKIKEIKGAGRYSNAFKKAALNAIGKTKFSPKTVNGKVQLSPGHETKFTFNVQ